MADEQSLQADVSRASTSASIRSRPADQIERARDDQVVGSATPARVAHLKERARLAEFQMVDVAPRTVTCRRASPWTNLRRSPPPSARRAGRVLFDQVVDFRRVLQTRRCTADIRTPHVIGTFEVAPQILDLVPVDVAGGIARWRPPVARRERTYSVPRIYFVKEMNSWGNFSGSDSTRSMMLYCLPKISATYSSAPGSRLMQ